MRVFIGCAVLGLACATASGQPGPESARGTRAQPSAGTQLSGCNAPLASPSVTVAVPQRPFAIESTTDGCWIFVSVSYLSRSGDDGGIQVLKRQGGRIEMVRMVTVAPRCDITKEYCPAPAGIALTHDGKLLVVAAGTSVLILDVARLIDGRENPIVGKFDAEEGKFVQSVYANVTRDDKLLFVSQEGARAITVIDLERARANGFKADAILGTIPVGDAPIALTFSPDGKWLYTTSESASPDWKWPRACKPEGPLPAPQQLAAMKTAAETNLARLQTQLASASAQGKAQLQESIAELQAAIRSFDEAGRDPSGVPLISPEGAVVVVDVARARTDRQHAVVAHVPAGCSAVRMAMSPDGGRIYVTARNNNAVEVFDTAKLISDPDHARVGTVPVGEAPVPVAVIDGGKKVVAGNSNRFAGGNAPQTLSVLDAAKMEQGANAALGTIPTGAFPRELRVSADGHTLFLTNAGSNSIQIIDIGRLPLEPAR
jgi:DNA-binding beta-propeller fold protein YncE